MKKASLARKFIFKLLGFENEEEIIDQLYFKALLDTYERIKRGELPELEGKITDSFIRDLENNNIITKDLIQDQILILTWERWFNVGQAEKSRADICFSVSGFEFVLECKKLEFADKKYLEEGIKRFIELKYAEKDHFAGMLGFIVQGNPKRIVENLKQKVKGFHPDPNIETLLAKKVLDHELSFQSRHLRVNEKPIHLYHVFFDFSK